MNFKFSMFVLFIGFSLVSNSYAKNLEEHCKSLSEDECMLSIKEKFKELPPEKRHEVFNNEKDFLKNKKKDYGYGKGFEKRRSQHEH